MRIANDPGTPLTRNQRILFWLLIAVGLLLRIGLAWFRSSDLETDPDAYVALAKHIVDESGYYRLGTTSPTAYRPPLYPIILSLLMQLGLAAPAGAAFINVLASLVTAIAVWAIARMLKFCNNFSLFALAIVTLDPLSLRYAVLPMTEIASGALLTLALFQVYRMTAEQTRPSAKHSVGVAAGAGLSFALAGLCRPICFVVCFFCTLWLLARAVVVSGRTSPRLKRHRLSEVVLLAGVAGLVLLPWVWRNYSAFGKFVPATTHGGYTLLLGNNEVFYAEVVNDARNSVWGGESLNRWQERLVMEMTADRVNQSSETEVDAWMYSRATSVIQRQNADFLQACLLRWKRFWALQPTLTSGGPGKILNWGCLAWYGLLWLGLLGSLAGGFRRRTHIQLLWIAIGSFLLIHTFYWTNTRMRAPLTGVFALLSTAGWQAWWKLLSHRQRRD